MKKIAYVLAAFAVCLMLAPIFVFVIDEREMAVVLRFGKPIHSYTEPGLKFKTPFADTVQRIEKYQQFWGDTNDELLPDLPTRDDKKIELIPWAIWRVNDPQAFVERTRSMSAARDRVAQIVRSTIRDVVTQYDLEEFVRSSDRELPVSENSISNEMPSVPNVQKELANSVEAAKPKQVRFGRAEILNRIRTEARKRLSPKDSGTDMGSRGIEIVDVGISQIGFVDSVRKKTFDRWVAERQAISARNVNEGVRLKAAIINETKSEVSRIEGEGQQRSSEIRGKTDAEVIKKYADAMQKTGEFFAFVRTLQAYEESIGPDTQLILSTNSPFFDLFRETDKKKP